MPRWEFPKKQRALFVETRDYGILESVPPELFFPVSALAPLLSLSVTPPPTLPLEPQPFISMKGTSLRAAMDKNSTQTLLTDRGNPTPIPLTNAVYR